MGHQFSPSPFSEAREASSAAPAQVDQGRAQEGSEALKEAGSSSRSSAALGSEAAAGAGADGILGRRQRRSQQQAEAAFVEYCALGPLRSLDRLIEVLAEKWGQSGAGRGPAMNTVKRWSARYDWQRRVQEYDRQRAREEEALRRQEIEEMNRRHIALALENQRRAVLVIERLIQQGKLNAWAAVNLLKQSVDLERLARGAVTERQEVRPDVSGLDQEQQSGGPRVVFFVPQQVASGAATPESEKREGQEGVAEAGESERSEGRAISGTRTRQ